MTRVTTISPPLPAPARDRLVPPQPGSALWGWLGPLIVTVFGGILRFWHLGRPHEVMFDETYYAKEALSLLRFGVETKSVEKPDVPLLAGGDGVFQTCAKVADCADYVVHPPLGKWTIALGEWMWGVDPFGWRFTAAVAGTLSILVLARTARRMTRSTLLGCFAGLLLAVDGMHLVMSRAALLDIFLSFWLVAAFACLVTDRDHMRARLAGWHAGAIPGDLGPSLGWRPWRLLAGVCLGAATATKWTGAFFLVAFLILSLLWDAGARRSIGLRRPYQGSFRKDLPLGVAWMWAVPVVLYLVSYTGWFASERGWGRNWAQATDHGWAFFVFDSIRSLVRYQLQALSFHTGLASGHSYATEPWQWPLQFRPVLLHYSSPKGCGAGSCSSAIYAAGTPILWFAALAAMVAMLSWYTATRDWRAGAVLLGYAAGWLPWFYYAIVDNRTMYQFYALPMVPFMILALTLVAGLALGKRDASPARRSRGAVAVGVFTLLVLANFAWLQPILTGDTITYDGWRSRLLYSSWVPPQK